ncbi:MAG: hypothetical protein J6O41_07240 [Clostridia bacterium]|nr:hypothetical protein [Clostridia bacterium]
MIFNLIINDDGKLDITVHDIFIARNNKNPIKILRVDIEEKRVLRLIKQKEDEYMHIAPLEVQIN